MERAWDLDEQHTVAPADEPQRDLLAGPELGSVPVGGGEENDSLVSHDQSMPKHSHGHRWDNPRTR